jgi:polysaccharide biosynthesis protein VpsM
MAPGKFFFVNWHIRGRKNIPLVFIAQIFVILSLAAALPCFAGEVKNGKSISEDEIIPLEKVEILTIDSRDKAESLVKTLEDSGYRSIVVTESLGGKPVYKVFILVHNGEQLTDSSGGRTQGSAEIKAAQDKEHSYDSDRKPSWDILGRQNRLVHGSLTLSGVFTDNVLNSSDNKKSDFSTLLSPALWLVFPHTNENIAPAALSVRSPGGSQLSRQWPDSLFHYQASLYYRTDIPLTSSSGHLYYGTTPAQTLSGRLLIKGNRFSLLAEDHYEYSYHEQEAGAIIRQGERDRYNSNYFGVTLSYDTQHRLVLSGGYSHFITTYQSDMSDFRNRQDNGLFGVLAYKLSPRVSLLAEYRFFGISYDHTGVLDSSEHYFLGGISWDITAKSKGLFKVGYSVKDFDHSLGSYNDFSLELQLDHRITPKTALLASAYRKPNETDLSGMAFSFTNGFDVQLRHILTPKLTSTVGFLVENDQYKQLHGLTDAAESTTYQWNAALQYAFRRWLRGTVGYAYTVKNSSVADLEYDSNTLFFNVIASF